MVKLGHGIYVASMDNETPTKKVDDILIMDQATMDELTVIRPENKQWVLQALGFSPKPTRDMPNNQWIHPIHGILTFDIHKDDLKDLIRMIHDDLW